MADLSPMMSQYMEIKEQNKDSILMFRLGDFYEMFFEDANIASRELDLVLTGRDCGQKERAPMCGVPYHSCEGYISRLVAKGYKVAICEQMEDPAQAKGIVRRAVSRIITPGTVIEDSMLDETRNNYLCTIYQSDGMANICFVDGSTGALYVTAVGPKDINARMCGELSRFMPREVLLGGDACGNDEVFNFINNRIGCRVEKRDGEPFVMENAKAEVFGHFGCDSADGLGAPLGDGEICAVGAALIYLKETQRSNLKVITEIQVYSDRQFMQLDISTRRNLELVETMRGRESRGSLLWVLDRTRTAMGKRMLRNWLIQPLMSVAQITERQGGVDELYGNTVLRGEVSEALSGVYDLERLMTRVMYGTVSPREMKALSYTLSRLPNLKQLLSDSKSAVLRDIYDAIDRLDDVRELIDGALVDDPPLTMKDGNIIRDGYNSEVDFLRGDEQDGRGFIARIEAEERERTGIKNLRIKYNKVFGYYIEVTNSYKDMVPEDYIRKQTLTNCERYITESLKQQEGRVLGAKERLIRLEHELFDDIRRRTAEQLDRIQSTASAVAQLDALCSLAVVAANNNYTRPNVNISGRLEIKGGRHPVVEAVSKLPFVPNDTLLDGGDNRCALITGPNMAGKSTYMRQVALIVLMTQIGSFVPAEYADVPICDAIFTRVGASDDLAAGQSTFMVEMSEVATILKNATGKSLLVFDEIGRGTSTFDGMAIARAVLEFVTDKRLAAKTMFATHYHELTDAEGLLPGVKNYNTAVKKRGEDITFLRRIVRGPADGSYGIDVARLAGIPDKVVSRAREILIELESGQEQPRTVSYPTVTDSQMSLTSGAAEQLVDEIKDMDINVLTPIEAMSRLAELIDRARKI